MSDFSSLMMLCDATLDNKVSKHKPGSNPEVVLSRRFGGTMILCDVTLHYKDPSRVIRSDNQPNASRNKPKSDFNS